MSQVFVTFKSIKSAVVLSTSQAIYPSKSLWLATVCVTFVDCCAKASLNRRATIKTATPNLWATLSTTEKRMKPRKVQTPNNRQDGDTEDNRISTDPNYQLAEVKSLKVIIVLLFHHFVATRI